MNRLAILKRARALLDPPGSWMQGDSIAGARYCILGALSAASGLSVLNFAYDIKALAVFDALGFSRACDAIAWNDVPSRTHGQVKARLTRAINGLAK